ncbi:sulfotransferase domain-containing protein [Psychroserpens sp.]
MRQPDFFVVGAAKSGTTALWTYFQQHPQIFVTSNMSHKELGYYTNEYGVSNKEQYLKYFKDAKPNQLIGEVCHAYLSSKVSSEWIKTEVPNAKIIILLRNPIDRAISLYNWMIMEGYENLNSFEKAIKREEKIADGSFDCSKLTHKFQQNYNYFSSGLYYEQVKRYYDEFGKENVLIIEFLDFKTRYKEELQKIFDFLKVETFPIQENLTVNKSQKVIFVKLQYLTRKVSISKYRKKRVVKKIINFIFRNNVLNKTPKKMNNAKREVLKEKYSNDINKLSDLTKINFNEKWLN